MPPLPIVDNRPCNPLHAAPNRMGCCWLERNPAVWPIQCCRGRTVVGIWFLHDDEAKRLISTKEIREGERPPKVKLDFPHSAPGRGICSRHARLFMGNDFFDFGVRQSERRLAGRLQQCEESAFNDWSSLLTRPVNPRAANWVQLIKKCGGYLKGGKMVEYG